MGIGRNDLLLLARLKADGYIPDKSSVIEIGAQQLNDNFLNSNSELENIGRLFGIESPCPLPPPLAPSAGARGGLSALAPLARKFWTWLGLDYAAIDIDGSPDSIPLDLNYDMVQDGHRGKFQVVTNYGTTEHVANQLNAFKIIHDLTAVGGIMLHNLPAQGMFNHGLVNYNPKFFWMLARSNGYKELRMELTPSEFENHLPWNIVEHICTFIPNFERSVFGYGTRDCGITVALEKVFDIDFVPPLDVATGTRTDVEALAERYWTIFTPGAFEGLVEAKRAAAARLSASQSDSLLQDAVSHQQ